MTSWTIVCQAPLSMGFSRQEHSSGLPFISLGNLSNAGIEPTSPALAGRFFIAELPGKPSTKEKRKAGKDEYSDERKYKQKSNTGEKNEGDKIAYVKAQRAF